jgi:hypothetical protein
VTEFGEKYYLPVGGGLVADKPDNKNTKMVGCYCTD